MLARILGTHCAIAPALMLCTSLRPYPRHMHDGRIPPDSLADAGGFSHQSPPRPILHTCCLYPHPQCCLSPHLTHCVVSIHTLTQGFYAPGKLESSANIVYEDSISASSSAMFDK